MHSNSRNSYKMKYADLFICTEIAFYAVLNDKKETRQFLTTLLNIYACSRNYCANTL